MFYSTGSSRISVAILNYENERPKYEGPKSGQFEIVAEPPRARFIDVTNVYEIRGLPPDRYASVNAVVYKSTTRGVHLTIRRHFGGVFNGRALSTTVIGAFRFLSTRSPTRYRYVPLATPTTLRVIIISRSEATVACAKRFRTKTSGKTSAPLRRSTRGGREGGIVTRISIFRK